jgi:monoamine oxidase
MKETGIIVIGAGMCGLSAAARLAGQGHRVTVLEGRDRIGGRIARVRLSSDWIDTGAEFIHGDAPETHELLKMAGAKLIPEDGEFYTMRKGRLLNEDEILPERKKIVRKLNEIRSDMTLGDFLRTHMAAPEDASPATMLRKMAEGFDAADPERFSALAVRDEWNDNAAFESSFIREGYTALIDHLGREMEQSGNAVLTGHVVRRIEWTPGNVRVQIQTGDTFTARKCIITVPPPVITSSPSIPSAITFSPGVPHITEAMEKIGFGHAIKFFAEFSARIWDDPAFGASVRQLPDLSLLVSDEKIPVWWVNPSRPRVLTGWVGGPDAQKLQRLSDESIRQTALQSLAAIFGVPYSLIFSSVTATAATSWGSDPFSLGAYSYPVVNHAALVRRICEPVENTLYFAGEALAPEGGCGTVNAALISARAVCERITDET